MVTSKRVGGTGCRDLDLWAYANNVTSNFSWPGKATENSFIEAFNSKLRAECLNAHRFMSLADALVKLEDWFRPYNEDRPHGAIGKNVPIAMHYRAGVTSPSSSRSRKNPASGDPRLGSSAQTRRLSLGMGEHRGRRSAVSKTQSGAPSASSRPLMLGSVLWRSGRCCV